MAIKCEKEILKVNLNALQRYAKKKLHVEEIYVGKIFIN